MQLSYHVGAELTLEIAHCRMDLVLHCLGLLHCFLEALVELQPMSPVNLHPMPRQGLVLKFPESIIVEEPPPERNEAQEEVCEIKRAVTALRMTHCLRWRVRIMIGSVMFKVCQVQM